jgi:hypothetical protein
MISENMINVYRLSIQKGLKKIEDIENLELRQKIQESLINEETNNGTN